MFLYMLELKNSYYELDYSENLDIMLSYIISAPTPEEARKIANDDEGGDEINVCLDGKHLKYGVNNGIWLKPKFVKIKKIGKSDVKKGVVMDSFNAG